MQKIWLFGRVRVQVGEGPVVAVKPERAQRLLACLALEAGDSSLSRATIVRLLWEGSGAQRPENSLVQALRELRSALGPVFDRLVREEPAALALVPGAWIDADQVRSLAEGDPAAARGLLDRPFLEYVQRSGSPWDHRRREEFERLRETLDSRLGRKQDATHVQLGPPQPGRSSILRPVALGLGAVVALGVPLVIVLRTPARDSAAPRTCPRAHSLPAPADLRVATAHMDARGPRRVGVVEVGLRPASIRAGREGMWLTEREGVALIDPRTSQQTTPVVHIAPQATPETAPFALALARDRVWVTRRDGVLLGIDRKRRRLVTRVRYGQNAGSVALAAGHVWVNNYDDHHEGSLTRVDPCTGKTRRFRIGRQANTVYAAFGSLWVSSSVDGAVFRVDPTTGRRQATIPGLSDPQDIQAAGGELWVAQYGPRSVQRVDPRRNTVLGRPLRIGPDPAALSAGAGALWIPLYGNGTLTRITIAKRRAARNVISAGQSPTDIAVGYGRLWIPNNDGNTVTVIRP